MKERTTELRIRILWHSGAINMKLNLHSYDFRMILLVTFSVVLTQFLTLHLLFNIFLFLLSFIFCCFCCLFGCWCFLIFPFRLRWCSTLPSAIRSFPFQSEFNPIITQIREPLHLIFSTIAKIMTSIHCIAIKINRNASRLNPLECIVQMWRKSLPE